MTDREKVIQWLEACSVGCEEGCPYEYDGLVSKVECKADLMRDALELIREQEREIEYLDNVASSFAKGGFGL